MVPLCVLIGAGTTWAQGSPSPAEATAAQIPAQSTPAPSAHVQPSHAAQAGKSSPSPSGKHASASQYHPDRFAGRAGAYYRLIWGVDDLSIKWGESGELIRFTYRVLDGTKAKVLNDHKNEPSLIDPQAGVKLVVPSMENVGQLRQTAPPEDGKSYWVVFSNRGRLVKRGDRVNVVIGSFHADGLVVD